MKNNHYYLSRRIFASVLAASLFLQSGCATSIRNTEVPSEPKAYDPPPTQFQLTNGKVAILIKAQAPEKQFKVYARSKSEAVNKQIESGIECMFDPRAIFLAPIAWPFCFVFTAGAATVSAIRNLSTEEIESSEANVNKALDIDNVQRELLRQIMAVANDEKIEIASVPQEELLAASNSQDYRSLGAKGIDTVLELDLAYSLISTEEGKSQNPPMRFITDLQVKLIKTSDNSESYSNHYTYRGKIFEYTEWAANNGKKLLDSLKTENRVISRDITDSVFLLYPFSSRKEEGDLRTCGLGLIYPPYPKGWPKPKIDDLQPTLHWQGFPRNSDVDAAPEEMTRVTNVRYEIFVATGDTNEPPEIIYWRDGLVETAHKIEIKLKPDMRYFWSVRARFDLDGRQRVTEWGTRCPFQRYLIVNSTLYRFYTPN